MHPSFGNGKICYIEIPARDISDSVKFYQTVFGWTIRTHADGTIAFDDGVGEVSGTWVTGKVAQTNEGIVIHIMVDDIVSSMEVININGGSILEGVDKNAPEITAKFSDPAGNIFGLFQQ